MKKSFNLFVLPFFFIIVSCSKEPQLKINLTEEETLKNLLKNKTQSVVWNEELEPGKITDRVENDLNGIADNIIVDNLTYKAMPSHKTPVYASMDGFGSLNSSMISKAQNKFINDFLNKISESFYSGPEDYFLDEYKFNYEFFKKDLREAWRAKFNKSFTGMTGKNKKTVYFSSWIIGEPVFTEKNDIIPVRLKTQKEYIDISIYMISTPLKNGIFKIEIKKMGEL